MRSKSLSNTSVQKRRYLFLLALLVVGVIFGIVFSLVISKADKLMVDDSITNFFSIIKSKDMSYNMALKESLLSNILYLSIVWLLGMSIIGIPIVIFMLFIRGFILGFSIGSIIRVYKYKGIIGAFLYVFPHHILSTIISVLLTFYAINFSFKLFKFLVLHKDIDFRYIMKRYLKILGLCIISFLICSLLEVYVSPILLNIFNAII